MVFLTRIPGKHRVYNLTVQGEHVYRVSTFGVLVHNNGCQGMNNPKTASAVKLGNQVHYDQFNGGTGQQLPSALAAKYPQTKFIFTPRGAKGVDVQVVKGTPHPSTYPGSK